MVSPFTRVLDCLALDFQINSPTTDESEKNALNQASSAMSAWHCKMRCMNDFDCQWFSWRHDNSESGIEGLTLLSMILLLKHIFPL